MINKFSSLFFHVLQLTFFIEIWSPRISLPMQTAN